MGDGLKLLHLALAALGAAWLQASAVFKKVGGLPSWSVQQDSPETAPTVGEWIRPGDQK